MTAEKRRFPFALLTEILAGVQCWFGSSISHCRLIQDDAQTLLFAYPSKVCRLQMATSNLLFGSSSEARGVHSAR